MLLGIRILSKVRLDQMSDEPREEQAENVFPVSDSRINYETCCSLGGRGVHEGLSTRKLFHTGQGCILDNVTQTAMSSIPLLLKSDVSLAECWGSHHRLVIRSIQNLWTLRVPGICCVFFVQMSRLLIFCFHHGQSR